MWRRSFENGRKVNLVQIKKYYFIQQVTHRADMVWKSKSIQEDLRKNHKQSSNLPLGQLTWWGTHL